MTDQPDGDRRGAALLPRAIDRRRGGACVAGAIALIGAVFAWQASFLDLGRIGLPGPGFFPLALGALIVAFAATIALESLRAPPDGAVVEAGHRDVLITLAALFMTPLLFEPLGAYVTLGLFGFVLLVLIARTHVLVALVAAVASAGLCWLFFEQALGVQLPSGPF